MNLERAILLVLSAAPRAITAEIIRGQIGQFTSIPATLTDVGQTLTRLESKGQAKGTATEDFGTLWIATDDGRLRVA